MRVVLPYPPSSNRYWRTCKGRTFVSKEANDYKDAVAAVMSRCIPIVNDVEVSLVIYRPAKRRDLDNHLKVLIDSMQGYAYENDSQIRKLTAEMFDRKNDGAVEVTITALEEQ